MKIRKANTLDVERIAFIEALCFPKAEAADQNSIRQRVETFANHFWVLCVNDETIGFINGMVTNNNKIMDEMYENCSLHNEAGEWQSVFGIDVLEEYRNQGYAAKLMNHLIEEARREGRRGCILTCKEHLIHYYEKFGYQCTGISKSIHGGTMWYDMILEF